MKLIKVTFFIFIFMLASVAIEIQAKEKSIIAYDTNSKRIFYEENANNKKLIASITKVMTAIITIENSNINKKVVVGEEISGIYGTNIYIEEGEEITIKDLLYGLILRSGNDAACVLAKNVGNTEKEFVKMMNDKAKQLGMNNTVFNNPHGLDDDTKNYSTAYDMALLSAYAMKNNIYRIITGTKKYKTITNKKNYIWYNRNQLLQIYDNCIGGKNGYTPNAGRTLITTAAKNNMEVTIVTLNDYESYNTHQKLYTSIFQKYKNYKLIDKDKFIKENIADNKNLILKESFVYPLTQKEKQKIAIKIKINKESKKTDSVVGKIEVRLYDNIIGNINIYSKNNVQKKENNKIFSKIKNYFEAILKKLKLGLQNNLNPGPFVPIPLDTNKSVFSIL